MPSPRGLAALLLLVAAPAQAQRMGVERPERERSPSAAPPTVAPAPEPVTPGAWYGTGAVVTDTVAAGLVVTAIVSRKLTLLLPGYLTYVLGAPINHLAHGQPQYSGIGVLVRTLPLLVAYGALAGTVREGDDESGRGRCGASCTIFYGSALVAPVVLAVLDDALVARYPESEDDAPRRPAATWTPLAAPVQGGWTVGAAGRF